MNLRRWLTPGIGVKRWLLVVFVGELGLALAGAFVLRQIYPEINPTGPAETALWLVTLQFLPGPLRAVIFAAGGVFLFGYGSYRLIRALTVPYRDGERGQPLVEVIYQKRFLARGPRIVAIGGGTGLSTLLRGLKETTSNLTAIVTVADDGGSSGILREQLGVPAVGDIRNCIVALADAEPLMGRLLQYRFPGDPSESLGGHAVGNLLLAAMTAVEDGDFEEAVRQVSRVLAVRGQVVPVSGTALTLHAETADGTQINGQSAVSRAGGIRRLWLTPEGVAPSEDALRAIAEAELIVLGPGSLYTSLLPALLLPEIRHAIAASGALRVYVCNVATQRGETEGFDLAGHVEAIERHSMPGLIDVVLANNRFGARVPTDYAAEAVRLRWPPASAGTAVASGAAPAAATPRLVLDDIVNPENGHHHDPARLAAAVLRVFEREGARRRSAVARTA
ncbi:MAG: YvcK family protein [Chloroflexi bacterium]|nr:YvcK family protein [Chloroflexota bacterium]